VSRFEAGLFKASSKRRKLEVVENIGNFRSGCDILSKPQASSGLSRIQQLPTKIRYAKHSDEQFPSPVEGELDAQGEIDGVENQGWSARQMSF
jgi:hypothetical protein